MTASNTAFDVDALYQRIGVAPVINAAGSITRLGGTRTRPETLEMMSRAARVMVNIDDLNRAAGQELARLTGAEAGFVSSGAAGGLVLQAAAVIAGNDPVKMRQLPNTDGLKNEIVIHTMHRFPYDQAYRAAGAKMVEFGDYLFSHPWQLEGRNQRAHRRRRIPLRPLLQQQGAASRSRLRDRPTPTTFRSSSTPHPCCSPALTCTATSRTERTWSYTAAAKASAAPRAAGSLSVAPISSRRRQRRPTLPSSSGVA